MLRLNAVASKPPAYPFIHLHFKEQEDKTSRGASFLAFPEPPCLQNFLQQTITFAHIRRNLPASVTVWRRLRFGEASFRETHKYPQEEKTLFVTISCQTL
jgi:hypothetical protein